VSPQTFDPPWGFYTAGSPLSWLTIDADLVNAARGWLATHSYTAERDYLAGHPELLAAEADAAVEEALRDVAEEEAQRYRMLREAARADGVEAAYRPMLLMLLAQELAQADLAGQRRLLAEHTADLASNIVGATLEEMAEQDETGQVQHAIALRTLALLGEHEPVLDALAEPARFYDLLTRLATQPDLSPLGPAVAIAFSVATTSNGAATAALFFAVVLAVEGDGEKARAVITEARYIAPERAGDWIDVLSKVGRVHPAVLDLIPMLTGPLPGERAAGS
jgi:hypothetical protein